MINYKEKSNGVDIFHNEKLVISHRKKNPAFFVGSGIETIKHYRGNFDISDFIEERIGLDSYQIEGNVIIFSHCDMKLKIKLVEKDDRLHISLSTNNYINRFWMRIYATAEEKVYGCGEQASYFNLRGRNFPLFTSEPGVGRDKTSLTTFYADKADGSGGDYYNTYYPEATYVSTRKYWLHADSYAYSEFNFEHPEFHELHFWETPREIIISSKETYLDLVEDITDFVGRTPVLPEYLLDGIVLGLQGGMNKVLEYLALAEQFDVKVSGLWCQDWAGYKHTTFGKRLFWNWTLNEDVYPGLVEQIKQLNKKGVAFLTYICPFLLEEQSLFIEAKENDYLVFNKEGDVYLIDFGEFFCGAVDLTNPKAFEWYKSIIQTNIIDLGVKGWMADFGEYLPTDCVLYNKKDALIMHNEWPVLWAKCNYEAVVEAGKLGQVFYFMRSGNFGSQKYATALWAGDQSVNWELHDGIASVIPSALSVGIIGNPFTHSDIGGYTSLYGNIRSKELFERWLEMSVFSSIMRTHEGNRPSENFQFYNDSKTLQLLSRMTKIRQELKPYISSLYNEAATKGYPLQRPLFMHYEDEIVLYDIQYSYMFGKDIIVVPVVSEHQIQKEVFLPQDDWIHLWTGEQYKGGNITVDAMIGYPPVFYKSDSPFRELFQTITHKYGNGGIE
jgi:alpha-glucosidase